MNKTSVRIRRSGDFLPIGLVRGLQVQVLPPLLCLKSRVTLFWSEQYSLRSDYITDILWYTVSVISHQAFISRQSRCSSSGRCITFVKGIECGYAVYY